jgi:hypothetical protein
MKSTGQTFITVDRINNIYFGRIQGASQTPDVKTASIYHAAGMENREVENNKEKLISQGDTSVALPNGDKGDKDIVQDQPLLAAAVMPLSVWHRRLGHVGLERIKDAAKRSIGIEISRLDQETTCEPCKLAHSIQKISRDQQQRADRPLQIIHMDTVFNTQPDWAGRRYGVIITDDYTRARWSAYFKHKDEVKDWLRGWINHVEAATKLKVLVIRTDNGSEFISIDYGKELHARGTAILPSAPYIHAQNGVSERAIGIVLDVSRAFRIDANLPKVVWSECLQASIWVINRLPTRANKDNMIPLVKWHSYMGRSYSPSFKHVKIYGCDAFVHIPKDKRVVGDKLAPRAWKGRLVGYEGEHGRIYRIWSPQDGKVHRARDVDFIEEEHLPVVNLSELNSVVVVSAPPPTTQRSGIPQSIDQGMVPYEIPAWARGPAIPEIQALEQQAQDASNDMRWRYPTPVSDQEDISKAMYAFMAVADQVIYEDAMAGPDKAQWLEAMQKEIKALDEKRAWDIVQRPRDAKIKIIPGKWVLQKRLDKAGAASIYKARWVACGNFEKKGKNGEFDTYAPVVAPATYRAILTQAARRGLYCGQADGVTAYLNAKMERDIYVQQPKGFAIPGKVCKLNQALYGLRDSAILWLQTLTAALEQFGFRPLASDPCAFIHRDGEWIIVYVDDMLFIAETSSKVAYLKKLIGQRFQLKDLGEAQYFLGMRILRDGLTIKLVQDQYVQRLLTEYKMDSCNPASTPMEEGFTHDKRQDKAPADLIDSCRQLCGALLYLAIQTRPDIQYAVCLLSRYAYNPRPEVWTALKRILRYLKGTQTFGITLGGSTDGLVTYADASFADCKESRRSTSGIAIFYHGTPLYIKTARQTIVTLSTTDAEFVALQLAIKKAVELNALVQEIEQTKVDQDSKQRLIIYGDNHNANDYASGKKKPSKWVDLYAKFIDEQISSDRINVHYIPSASMPADGLTKPLGAIKFMEFRKKIGVSRLID